MDESQGSPHQHARGGCFFCDIAAPQTHAAPVNPPRPAAVVEPGREPEHTQAPKPAPKPQVRPTPKPVEHPAEHPAEHPQENEHH